MLSVGTEWLVDAVGCRAGALCDAAALREVFARLVSELELRVVGEAHWHEFPAPGGVTGLALLSESHLACHTYPEFGVATFNLYCCRARPRWNWEEQLAELLGAQSVSVRVVERGDQAAEALHEASTAEVSGRDVEVLTSSASSTSCESSTSGAGDESGAELASASARRGGVR